MSKLFSSFPSVSKAEWVELLGKELKGEPIEALQKVNQIEEIAFPSYFHAEDALPPVSDPGMAPYTRGVRSSSNDWQIGGVFEINNLKETNTELLAGLMAGTTSLVLKATGSEKIDFSILLNEVGLQYIHTSFYPKTKEQAIDFIAFLGNNPGNIVFDNNDILLSEAKVLANKAIQPFCVNAYLVQQAGGTTWQEMSIALAEGHEIIVKQLDLGLTIDEAAANIHFVFGLGSTYFLEVCKFRAFRTAWATIIERYAPQHACSMACTITAQTGFINYSLKDPYTNLLRQTTEALSAVVGGIDHLVIQPYDTYAAHQNLRFTRRMATNISLLLKDEAYMHFVADPSGGSFALEALTATLQERAWAEFKGIERNGGIENTTVRAELNEQITAKRNARVHALKDKSVKRIGINVFPNPETIENNWQNVTMAWNQLPSLILELEA